MDDSRLHAVRPNNSSANENDESDESASRTLARFGDVEDVISVGALMRPTLAKAMATLTEAERHDLKAVLLEVETHLAKASLPYAERFGLIRETFTRTYRYGPIWRFISGRIEECWTTALTPSLREFSMVSLLIGMIFEEAHRVSGTGTRRDSRLA